MKNYEKLWKKNQRLTWNNKNGSSDSNLLLIQKQHSSKSEQITESRNESWMLNRSYGVRSRRKNLFSNLKYSYKTIKVSKKIQEFTRKYKIKKIISFLWKWLIHSVFKKSRRKICEFSSSVIIFIFLCLMNYNIFQVLMICL